MDQKEVKQEAQRLEQMAIEGQESALAQELHKLDPADRRAVAKQMEKDAQKDTSGFLPEMEFTSGGDLRFIVDVDRIGSDNHKVIIRKDFDPATGKLQSWDLKGSDGSSGHGEYDSVTGKEKFYDEKDADGSTEHAEFNSTTGHLKSKDLHEFVEVEFPFFPDLKFGYFIDQHREYDAVTGQATVIDIKGPGGNTTYHERSKYDPATRNRISEEVINGDGSTKHTEYDPATGNEKVVYEKDKDGTTTHAEYKYDATTRKLQAIEVQKWLPDGSTEHFEVDSTTGKRKDLRW